jgi:hypothetical protein
VVRKSVANGEKVEPMSTQKAVSIAGLDRLELGLAAVIDRGAVDHRFPLFVCPGAHRMWRK